VPESIKEWLRRQDDERGLCDARLVLVYGRRAFSKSMISKFVKSFLQQESPSEDQKMGQSTVLAWK